MITKLYLRNFKCFEEQELPLAPLTLLTGINGMGKSSVIQALLLLRQTWEKNEHIHFLSLNDIYVDLGTAKDVMYQYYQTNEIVIEIDYEQELDYIDEEFVKLASELFNKDGGHWEMRGNTLFPTQEFIKETKTTQNSFFASLFSPNFHYLNAERTGPRTSYSFVKNHKNPLGKFGEHTAQYLAQHFDDNIFLEKLKHPKESDSRLFMQINAWLSDIRPGTTVQARMFESLDLASLEFKLDKGPNAFRPTNVGFGLSYTLPILVALLTAQKGTFIILENPEAHLHPAGQAAIGKLLALAASQGVQIIVETHSDHLLNGVRVATKHFEVVQPEHTQILYFTGEHVGNRFQHYILTPKLDKNGKLDFWPEGFFDEYSKQLSQL